MPPPPSPRQDVEIEALRAAVERYRTFVALSSEAIARLELPQPTRTDAPAETLVDAIASAQVVECNDAYARLYEADHANLTTAGRIVKRIYADELPQIVNVLRGDISLVGPRPWPVTMVETQVAKGLDYRLHVIAGWTGPAQVRKDSKAKSKATELDLEYVELCRTLTGPQLVRHDLKVIRQSLRTVLRARGLRY